MDQEDLCSARAIYLPYWGKTGEVAGDNCCHLLAYHCLDVAAIGQALLTRQPRLGRHFSGLTGLDESAFNRWLVFFLTLHDLGKFADSFQQLAPKALRLLGREPRPRGYLERHDTLGYYLWREIVRPLFIERGIILTSGRSRGVPGGEGLDQCLRAVTGHHGQPPKATDVILRDYLDLARDGDAVCAFVSDLHALLLDGETLPAFDADHMKHAAWWLAGFTVLCDWLGSSRPAESFSCQPQSLADYWHAVQPWAEERVRQAGLLPDAPAARFDLADCFTNAEPAEIQATPLQTQAADVPLGEGSQLFLLEDVTGAGKTEAALLLAQRLMAAGRATCIYFGLPTMATSNAMYERLRYVYRRLYAPGSEPSLVLAHSASRLSDSFMDSLAKDAGGEYGDHTLSADAHCNAWLVDNRKKALLAEVGVGTIRPGPARHPARTAPVPAPAGPAGQGAAGRRGARLRRLHADPAVRAVARPCQRRWQRHSALCHPVASAVTGLEQRLRRGARRRAARPAAHGSRRLPPADPRACRGRVPHTHGDESFQAARG